MAKPTVPQAKAAQAASVFSEIATIANTTREICWEIDDNRVYAVARLIETMGWMADYGLNAMNGDHCVGSPMDWMLSDDGKVEPFAEPAKALP